MMGMYRRDDLVRRCCCLAVCYVVPMLTNDRWWLMGDDGWLLVACSKPCAFAPLPLLSCFSWTLSRVSCPPVAVLAPNLGRQDPNLSVLRCMSRVSIPADDQCPRKRNRKLPAWSINPVRTLSHLRMSRQLSFRPRNVSGISWGMVWYGGVGDAVTDGDVVQLKQQKGARDHETHSLSASAAATYPTSALAPLLSALPTPY